MIVLSRFLAIVALMYWLGGFVFYSSLVVPTGRATLKPPSDQAFVTAAVTGKMAWVATGAWLVLLLEWLQSTRSPWRFALLCGLAALQVVMALLHGPMVQYMDASTLTVVDVAAIRPYHKAYMVVGSIQIAMALIYIGLTVAQWHHHDQKRGA